MSKFKFTIAMFMDLHLCDRTSAVEMAQAALDKHLESLKRVQGVVDPDGFWFNDDPAESDTHTAVLFNLEPIEKAECKHVIIRYESKNPHPVLFVDCARCGAKLRAKWEVLK